MALTMQHADKETEAPPRPLYGQLRPVTLLGGIMGLFPLLKFWSRSGPPTFRICSPVLLYTAAVWSTYGAGVYTVFRVMFASYTASDNQSPVDKMVKYFFMSLSAAGSIFCLLLVLVVARRWDALYAALDKRTLGFLFVFLCAWLATRGSKHVGPAHGEEGPPLGTTASFCQAPSPSTRSTVQPD
ncbi:hypothetical protein C7M84_003068 [Penaeus vannamei]|uniref:Uncharacterized protein n=1 Tax=Penaeus vannamei TaxID=6689 RepID=A0A3R7QTW5_PENVA|nr:hypothetical protein C7M84_003068 [Penaeus vannamei]